MCVCVCPCVYFCVSDCVCVCLGGIFISWFLIMDGFFYVFFSVDKIWFDGETKMASIVFFSLSLRPVVPPRKKISPYCPDKFSASVEI